MEYNLQGLQRYRLYIDESGDHSFRSLDRPVSRFLCLLGCFFGHEDYLRFHAELEAFKLRHIPHSPDDPVVLHRAEIVNQRGAFWRLRDPARRTAFDADLVTVCSAASFRMVAIVIDKLALREQYPAPAHPYHLALGFLLQRYCGYLNHISRQGDVMAESRGAKEDALLQQSYQWTLTRGVWSFTKPQTLRQALTSGELKLKKKPSNIAGLQLADMLAHPVKQRILQEKGLIDEKPGEFGQSLTEACWPKLNRHLYDGRVEGYGIVVFPRGKA